MSDPRFYDVRGDHMDGRRIFFADDIPLPRCACAGWVSGDIWIARPISSFDAYELVRSGSHYECRKRPTEVDGEHS